MITDFNNENSVVSPELLGFWEIFGLGLDWREKIFEFMKKRTKGMDIAKYVRYSTIDNLDREYLSLLKTGYTPIEFKGLSVPDVDRAIFTASSYNLLYKMINNLKLPLRIVDLYLRAIWYGAHLGAIPYEKWNPEGYIEKEDIKKSWESEKNWLDKAQDMTKINVRNWIIGGSLLVGGVLILNNLLVRKFELN